MHFYTVDDALQTLSQRLRANGQRVPSRNGETLELQPVNFTLVQPRRRECLLPSRKANIAAQIAETAWVLAGRNDVEWLAHYLPRAADFSDDGQVWRAGYGPRIRSWAGRGQPTYNLDQLQAVIYMLKDDPGTRRAVISLWDPELDYVDSKDIPCNNWLHFLARDGRLHLNVATRSNDIVWGWSGINQFEWSVLLEVVAAYTGLQMGNVHYNISSLHAYERHYGKLQQLSAPVEYSDELEASPRFDPTAKFTPTATLDHLLDSFFDLEAGIREGLDVSPDTMEEPMLRSWLQVLRWYWSGGDTRHIKTLEGTRLYRACELTPKSVIPQESSSLPAEEPMDRQPFLAYATQLHADKDKAYGDSWIRRGEMLGVLANLARKVDRLGVNGAGDTALDTATDLMIYLAKYRSWQLWPSSGKNGAQHVKRVTQTLAGLESTTKDQIAVLERRLSSHLNTLEVQVTAGQSQDVKATTKLMLDDAYQLARRLYWQQGNEHRAFEGYEAQ